MAAMAVGDMADAAYPHVGGAMLLLLGNLGTAYRQGGGQNGAQDEAYIKKCAESGLSDFEHGVFGGKPWQRRGLNSNTPSDTKKEASYRAGGHFTDHGSQGSTSVGGFRKEGHFFLDFFFA